MKQWRRWTALALMAALLLTAATGCTKEQEGFEFSASVGAAPETLDPIYAVSESAQTLLTHLYEGLLRTTVSVAGEATVQNGIAKSVNQESSPDGAVTYTFKLRSAKWSDGHAVTAEDFVYAWRRLANPACKSPYAALLSAVVGYEEARSSGDMSLLQVTAKNDSTLVVVLSGPCEWFLSQVCTAPATLPLRKDVVQRLKELAQEANAAAEEIGEAGTAAWWSNPVSLVTNGPYQVAVETAEKLDLKTAEKYTGNRPGPAELHFYYADTPEAAWALYQDKTVDFVWPLPTEELVKLDKGRVTRELSTYTVLFNGQAELFTDPLVRQALFLTVDRNAISLLAGATALPAEGLVPDGVSQGEDTFRNSGGPLMDNDPAHYADLCKQGRDLLQQAGYDSGLDIPAQEYLFVDEGPNAAVAQELADMWYTALRVRVAPRAVTRWELDEALRSGSYAMAAVDAGALGNDAECFLMRWASGREQNVIGYANSAYDTLMSIISSASDDAARLGCLHDAESLLLGDFVLVPLYTTGTGWELRDTYTGVCRDARGWFSFEGVGKRVG